MKPRCIKLSLLMLLFLPSMLWAQDTLKVFIDKAYCSGGLSLKGEFGLYVSKYTANFTQVEDSLVQQLTLRAEQLIFLPSGRKATNYLIRYTPTDTASEPVQTYLKLEELEKREIHLTCYFFRTPIHFLNNMVDGDTFIMTNEYNGPTHAGMIRSRSTVRIIRRTGRYFYERNNLPTSGDLVWITFPGDDYENGYAEPKEMTPVQLKAFRKFEKELDMYPNPKDLGPMEISIQAKGRKYEFVQEMIPKNGISIWQMLE